MRNCLVVAVAAVAAATACGTSEEPGKGRGDATERGAAEAITVNETETVSGYGFELTVPARWEARVYLAQEVTPVLQAANFPLPPRADDLPAEPPVESFGDGDIYLALFDLGDVSHGGVPQPSPVPWTDATLPLAVEEAHFRTPGGLEPPPKGLSLARRYLVVGGRAFVLRVALATETATAALVAEANGVLSTLALGGWRPAECPPNWPGPWTACPEADWVRRVAEGAGYRVVGDTGSSLVARGGGRGFSIWATELAGKELSATAKRENWRRLGVVEGTEVFGDEESWRWWPAQGFVFWLSAGPRADATIPELAEMALLVRTSLELPPPEP